MGIVTARESGRRVSTVLQLRVHPQLIELQARLRQATRRHQVQLTYITSRGPWYSVTVYYARADEP